MEASSKLREYFARLEALPFVKSCTARIEPFVGNQRVDAAITVRTKTGTYELLAEVRRSHLTSDTVARLIATTPTRLRARLLLLAPHVGARIGHDLAAAGINYLDLGGNCHLQLNGQFFVHIEGRTKSPPVAGRAIRAPGYRVLFAFLADSRLVDAPVREVAEAAGASRQAVSDMRRRLLEEGFLAETKTAIRWISNRREDALDRWLHGYRTTVRPAMLLGTYRTADRTPAALEERIAPILRRKVAWRWGGTTAGFRMTGHYRGERTTIHVQAPPDFASLVDLIGPGLSDPRGNLVLLDGFGTLTWSPDAAWVHPLLVYSEMLAGNDERATEAAQEVFDEHLRPLWNEAK